MSYILKQWAIGGLSLCCLVSCERNLDSFENEKFIDKLVGVDLCSDAEVKLKNKEQLNNSAQEDNLDFEIKAPKDCLDKFSSSFFPEKEIIKCTAPSQYACLKKNGHGFISIHRSSSTVLEMSRWS